MKLYNSIVPLSNLFDNEYLADKENRDILKAALDKLDSNERIKDTNTAFRWLLWNNLKKVQRDYIIGKSVDESDMVGGFYQSVNDKHIDTLLKKVLPITKIARLKSC